ncbi:MAG: hypothetical protein ACLR4Z_07155 [Butyricicoccaceae bacterium]
MQLRSPGDAAAIAAIADTVRGATICSLAPQRRARTSKQPGTAIRRAESARIHTFLATSPVHMEYKLKMTPDEVIESIAHSVAYAKSFCSDVEFSAEDATRSDLDFLCRVVETAIKAGATTINIPDTVGYMIPEEYASRIKYLREHTDGIENVVLSRHMHNDLGMAVANSLAGVEAGIDQIECTINGIGERAGNASMEECAMALKTRADHFGIGCNIETTQIYRASRMIQTITGVAVAPTKADRRRECVRTRSRHPSARRHGEQGDLRNHDPGVRRHPEERYRAGQAFRPPCVRRAPA